MTPNLRLLHLAVAALGAACSAHETLPQPPPAVRIETVAAGARAGETPRYSAIVQAKTQVPLAFRVPGYVAQLMTVPGSDGQPRALAEGDRIRRNDVLARLRPAEYQDKVAQATGQAAAARAAADKAQLDWDRASRLFASQSITKPEFDGAKAQQAATQAQLSAAQAALQEATVALHDTALVSPLDGDVIKKAVEPGALVGPGSLAFVVADASSVKVVIGVPDLVLRSLALGQAVTVSSDALPGRKLEAHVSRIAAAADPATRNFDVEMSIDNPDRLWKVGMIASVELTAAAPKTELPRLPFSAIVQGSSQGDGFAVMVVDTEAGATLARLRQVELGEVIGNRVVVTRGLSPGERVITTGASLLADGQRVEVVPEAPGARDGRH